MSEKLLTRDEFREAVFKRDGYKCIFCDKKAEDAHHILERRLWDSTSLGQYISNGVSVCHDHHLECEKTLISVEDIRIKLNITNPALPDHFYHDVVYDKWGNTILPNGKRTPGELFHDESVQKILKEGDVLHLFVKYVKYPRTYHLPFSPGMNSDDRMIKDCSQFENKEIVVTEKMDGGNVTLYSDYIHARSIDSKSHASMSWIKGFWAKIKNDIPPNLRIVGENLYAQHSIIYNNLESFFYGISIWSDQNICLSWNDTLEYFELLNIKIPKILYKGYWDENIIKNLYDKKLYNSCEGFVVRNVNAFVYKDFRYNVAKYVRKNHVQTTKHWFYGQELKLNKINE